MLRVVVLLLLCIAATYTPGHCEARASRDVEHARLPEFLSELDLSSLEASEEDVEALKKIVKRLAPEKNGEYQVYQGVTGQPGVDYPALTSIPATSFSCRGLRGGYYADLETNCQVFHICDNGRKISFLCPNGTIFQQSQLICDWWFKVDCSKSTELYEQSAEQLAEEERKRADARKMKSEFHRTLVGQQDGYYESADYDGRQNGRTNPYGQEVSAFGPNNVFDDRYHHQREKSEASGERTTKQSRRYHEAGSNYQAGNHLVDASGKFQDSRPGDQSAYGDAHRANSGREKPRNSKSRGPTRNNLLGSSQPQKATPSYTETTTFRSTTASPPREFQQFAESAAFVSNRGNRLNDGKSDRQFYHHSYEQHRLEDRETSTVTQRELDEDSNRVSFTPKTGAPQYPGPTYAPIYKPRTTTIPAYETTLQYAPTTGFYRQEETTTGEPVTASTDYPTTESTTYPQTPASIGRVPPAANYPQQYADATTRPNTESYDTSEAYPSSTPYEGTESSPSFRQNSISSTEKPWRSTNVYQQSGSTGKTLSPYDTSFTYKQGKVLSTLGPYVPFTKNYVYSSTMSSTPRPAITASTYSPTIADYRITTSNLIPKVKSTSRPKDRATYLPETSTALEDRPYAEREHALSMLHSLQGLESKASEKRPAAPTSRNIPFGPSTLHSLALYFATAGDDSNETAEQPGETGSVELPTSILTQHTIASYAELFNLNNALEGNGTESELTAEADDDEVGEDLEIEESEGPLNAARKTNGTKLRELAQVFTHALSAYLQDPDTFKKVLTEIRPTEPTTTDGGQSADATTFYPTTVEEYSSVTKEKDEVLDFSDDSARRRKPATTTDRSHTTSHDDYYSTSASQTTRKSVHYPSTTLLPPGDSTETTTQVAGGNTFAYEVNHVFGTTAASDIRGFDARDSTDLSPVYDNYFPSSEDEDGSRNNSFQPYGKNVKPADATPISNYVASSTVASYQPPLGASTSSWGKGSAGDKPVQDLTPPHYQRFGNVKSFEVSNSIVPSQPTTPLPRIEPTYEAASSTVHPFRIRYYESTPSPEDRQSPESLVTARSSYVKFRNNRIEGSRKPAENVATTVATVTSRDVTATVSDVTPYTGTSANTSGESSSLSDDHWTSSPMVTQLWETTVFVDPRRVNHGLTFSTDDTQPPSTTDSGVNEPELITGAPSTPSTLPPEDNTGETTTSSPWQWAPNDNNSPVAFTLLPTTFAAENTASPIIATRSSVTTTITSSVTTDSVSRGTNPPSSSLPPFTVTAGRWNATENEAMKAQEMFGKLNETSSDTLMRVMKQADNNETVRQLVLLLINHCNGPRNKTMEQEKEQLLDALLRMPVNEFSSEESREIVAGISRLSLPIGKIRAAGAASSSTTTTTTRAPRASSVRPTSSEPSITTFRSSRAGRRFRTTTESTNGFARRSDEDVPADASNSLSEDETVASDGRALELLRSLYTVAAKWG
ncbi:PREDICTED: mucin-5AC isoform X2 [Dinoponera quadriceps]|uniref:Mucin-5AC isoform X2 n=1 Tax=Dinoponera quadriceps TaxID=609295 RepID=A0A6P3XVW1_DINQU|nr:PREDICTED: mucin-5AC isoform X2 [Dinoponera quadriceps]